MSTFWRGFRAVIPLWLGMIPFGLAYAVTARGAGLNPFETQLMSLIVFSGGAQFSAAGLLAAGASGVGIVLTTFLINLRHLLYGLSLGRRVRLNGPQKLIAAYFLTDEAFGVTVVGGEGRAGYLFGAELSVFVVWNLSTLVGSLLSSAVPAPERLGIDFVFPLAFLALLIPLLTSVKEVGVALFAGLAALGLSQVTSSGVAVLVTGVLGALLGALWTRGDG